MLKKIVLLQAVIVVLVCFSDPGRAQTPQVPSKNVATSSGKESASKHARMASHRLHVGQVQRAPNHG